MTFESEGLLIVAIYTWLPPASYVVFSDNSGLFDLTRRDRAFILHMCIPGDKTFHIVP